MIAQLQDSPCSTFCKVVNLENQPKLVLYAQVPLVPGNNDEIEQQIERFGQHVKQISYQHAVEAADRQIAETAQAVNGDLVKNGTAKFTFMTRFGEVEIQRQRLRNKKDGTSITPSAIAWNTSQNRHINQSVVDQICEDSQNESYRKTTAQLRNISGQESFLSTTTVWKVKQKQGKKIEQDQNDLIESVTKTHAKEMIAHGLLPADFVLGKPEQNALDTAEPVEQTHSEEEQKEIDEVFFHFVAPDALETCTTVEAVTIIDTYTSVEICTATPFVGTDNFVQEEQFDPLSPEARKITHEKIRQRCHVDKDTISVQLDEVLSKSQEKGKKWNLTANATVEDDQGNVHYWTAKSTQGLLNLVAIDLVMLGVMTGKKLEILGDGASWIETWAKGLSGFTVTWILCWYHLSHKVYELLSGLGWKKAQKKAFEHQMLGALWHGNVAEAVWLLWGVRSQAKTPERIDELIGYLLRKRSGIVNYSERHARGLWIASTRVEKWNDLSVADRCKRRGMSWTLAGVMAVAYHASENRNGITCLNTAN